MRACGAVLPRCKVIARAGAARVSVGIRSGDIVQSTERENVSHQYQEAKQIEHM